ncbi:MAG: protein-glutamate O-methyltransferase CheR [Aquisalimonadaceae bacterium]
MAVSDGYLPHVRQGAPALPDMDDRQFEQWAGLLEERTGMTMPRARKSFLVTSVGMRMREIGYEDFDTYYAHLTSGLIGNLEWNALVDRLTVHETRFFRDPRALDVLSDTILPELVRRPDWDGDLNVWSVGCSTGEEVCTLAMVLDAFAGAHTEEVRFGITGTDISLQSLSVARTGVYGERRARQIPDGYRVNYCEVDSPGRFRLIHALRRRLAFAQMNVLDAAVASPRRMDVIYCQNLLIYFARPRRVEILNGLVRHLRPGGALVLGAGEMMNWTNPVMERLPNRKDVLAYRRRL